MALKSSGQGQGGMLIFEGSHIDFCHFYEEVQERNKDFGCHQAPSSTGNCSFRCSGACGSCVELACWYEQFEYFWLSTISINKQVYSAITCSSFPAFHSISDFYNSRITNMT